MMSSDWFEILTKRARELDECIKSMPPYNEIRDSNLCVKKRMMEKNLELANKLIVCLRIYSD